MNNKNEPVAGNFFDATDAELVSLLMADPKQYFRKYPNPAWELRALDELEPWRKRRKERKRRWWWS
ncbi:hypothetical protein [Corynebacterium lowii]|uniref:Uncharacterized protein n=1 Tax=Corynebacterium lowii TaxID=1544413 RepID=A0A0Q0ZBQ8_9CORY|nr:hypothetical protein [Corynebacterium lowii]KQB87465.1 hypothetical protein Clow_00524 [Corynebacterium lowii]MDP9851941.1 hypothetical protein [Corynebacterium lowii]